MDIMGYSGALWVIMGHKDTVGLCGIVGYRDIVGNWDIVEN